MIVAVYGRALYRGVRTYLQRYTTPLRRSNLPLEETSRHEYSRTYTCSGVCTHDRSEPTTKANTKMIYRLQIIGSGHYRAGGRSALNF